MKRNVHQLSVCAVHELGYKNLLPRDGEAYLIKNFFSPLSSEKVFRDLLATTPWRQDPIKIYGRDILQPRLTSWMGDPGASYRYSGLLLSPESWSLVANDIRLFIQSRLGLKFNSALLNYYRCGQDSMGWHRDNESELGPQPIIASASFGESRRFKIRHYFNKKLVLNLELQDGDLLVMAGPMQTFWEHSIPKTRRPKGSRINITFRSVDIVPPQV